jgi:hypothetical protein
MFGIKVSGYDINGEPLLLADGIKGEGRKILIFSTKESAEKECRDMNAVRARMKTPMNYEVVKIKKEWIDGMPIEYL